ncbi:MAG: alpha-2-macroglobulin, partial [Maribacter sp.]|nr:alpha-2-macroglobulin [Maribacter sp.]
AVVDKITIKAKREKNSPQIVKSLLYSSKYALTLEEDAQLKIINDFKDGIAQSEAPTKNVLESYLANLYWQYFQQNRYQFYNRTKAETKIDTIDFRTWDLSTLFEEINIHFQNSLTDPVLLQKVKVNDFKPILQDQKGSKLYRPTLFDLLAHTALAFYKTPENNITRPANKFEISNPDLLCEANEFIEQELDLSDKTSLQSKALGVYQELLRFHTKNTDLKAFVDVDIARLKFVHQNAVFTEKDRQFLEVLKNAAEATSPQPVSGLYSFEIASYYNQEGNSYNPKTNTTNQWKQKEAVELCDLIIKQFPKSNAANKSRDLKARIVEKRLQLKGEQFLPINKPSRILVNYKNHDSLNLSAFKVSNRDLQKLDKLHPETKKLGFIQKLKMYKSWETILKNEGDFQNHSIEVLVPELENGQYIILAKAKEKSNSFAYTSIQVTDLALVETRTQSQHIFQVIDRNNGKPMHKASLKLSYQENYDRAFLTKIFTTDSKGIVKIPFPKKRWTSIKTMISSGDDAAYFGDYFINPKYDKDERNIVTYKSFLFTDRSIYRPGQPLYFKGILMETFEGKSKVAINESVFVTLYDVNRQKVSELDLETNDFGSINGNFIIPISGLTGEYYLEIYGVSGLVKENYYFSVEEYKRPKFETSFEPITDSFKVNDSIVVTGKATAYAGSNITQAKVTYRVKRIVNFPRWYFWYRPYFNSPPQEIAHGETITDASGKYQIKFKGIPDNTIDKASLPIFNYEVTADVTDINGETHSTTTTVRVGYHAMTANISINESVDKDKKDNKLTVNTKNLNGQFVPAKGVIRIFKYKAPSNVLR